MIVAGVLAISAVFSYAIHRFVKKDHGSFVIQDTDEASKSVFSGNNAYHVCSAYPTSLSDNSGSTKFENCSSGNGGSYSAFENFVRFSEYGHF